MLFCITEMSTFFVFLGIRCLFGHHSSACCNRFTAVKITVFTIFGHALSNENDFRKVDLTIQSEMIVYHLDRVSNHAL